VSRDWNILLVEDNPEAAKLVEIYLSDLPHRSRTAQDGQEAILIAGNIPPQLVIMDLSIPELSGLEASRYLKHKFSECYLPILVLTSDDSMETRVACGEVGCDSFLTKSEMASSLAEEVNYLISLGKAENRLTRLGQRSAGKTTPGSQMEESERVCEIRAKLADKVIARGYVELVENHCNRIKELNPNHSALERLYSALR
jgi:DNA-binding response OmpR family regulator